MKLEGRIAIVTGAARGIGYACARRFAEEGAKVVLADIDGDTLRSAVDSLVAEGFEAVAQTADVSRYSDLQTLVDAAVAQFGRLDIMVNNAGIARTQDFMTISEEDYDAVLGVNLRGAFFGLQIAARAMIAAGNGGVIINMSSINSRMANPSVATYAISKGGLNQVTSTAAVALIPHGIRVVGIGPGTIATDMLNMGFLTNEAQRKMILSRTPSGRLGEAEEVAAVAAFLASDDASYIVGQTIFVDGGRMILNYVMPEAENA
ncbi:SDR family NAD(P)-dependent oxidoreductase [Sphingosinicella rhizophila]|uniref:SDR family oxidoreductase n=1 Tax=Sphingosinicella rhizophila TaxID=3050082 RepID=A0ABU3Q644_9SPHN|nr:SDR family oxidoreductase [Sphingosinicella sp. GR2756]MDT9598772.1 SDR family oxidoreductase [Sphingosinicella sp. GR2756]